MSEEWRPVPNYEGRYSVSSLGRVRAEERRVMRGVSTRSRAHLRRVRGRILKSALQSTGYPTVCLYREGHGTTFLVHRLVALAFIGDVPGLQVNHLDSDRANPRLDNLELVTPAANIAHARDRTDLPRSPYGSRDTRPNKLTEDDVRAIRSSSLTYAALAKLHGVSMGTIGLVRRRSTWRHVE